MTNTQRELLRIALTTASLVLPFAAVCAFVAVVTLYWIEPVIGASGQSRGLSVFAALFFGVFVTGPVAIESQDAIRRIVNSD